MKILTPKQYRRVTWIGIVISMGVFPFTIIALAIACEYIGILPSLPKNYDFYNYWDLSKKIFYVVSRAIAIVLIFYGGFLLVKAEEGRRQVTISLIIILSFSALSWLVLESVVTSPTVSVEYNFLGN